MELFTPLWRINQRAQALVSHLTLLCESEEERYGGFHTASMADFLRTLCEARDEITEELAALEQVVRRALALLPPPEDSALTYRTLCEILKIFTPYLDAYPALSAAEAWRHFVDNTLNLYFPLPTSPSSAHQGRAGQWGSPAEERAHTRLPVGTSCLCRHCNAGEEG